MIDWPTELIVWLQVFTLAFGGCLLFAIIRRLTAGGPRNNAVEGPEIVSPPAEIAFPKAEHFHQPVISVAPKAAIEQCDVFVSFSKDMENAANLIKDDLEASESGVVVYNYRDIDPVTVDAGPNWQDLILEPSKSGASLIVVLFGRRIGTQLPADFKRRGTISARLKGRKYDWIHVPGVDPNGPGDGQVPLTGVLYELMDVWLANLDGANTGLLIVMGGSRGGAEGPHWPSLEALDSKSISAEIENKIRSVDTAQTRWLLSFYRKFLEREGKNMCVWANHSPEQARLLVRDRLNETDIRGWSPRLDDELPGPGSYGPKHGWIYRPKQVELTRLWAQVARRSGARAFVPVIGDSGSGKSSLLKAGLIPKLNRSIFRGRGFRPILMDLSDLTEAESPVRALGRELATVNFGPGATSDVKMFAELLSERGDCASALNVIERVQRDTRRQVGFGSDALHIVIIIDQLEIGLAEAERDTQRGKEYKEFLNLLFALGGALASKNGSVVGSSAGQEPPFISVVCACQSHSALRLTELAPNTSRRRLGIDGEVTASEVRDIVESTLLGYRILFDAKDLDAWLAQIEREFGEHARILPFISVALFNLQRFWREVPFENRHLTLDNLKSHGDIAKAIDLLGEAAWVTIEQLNDELRGRAYSTAFGNDGSTKSRKRTLPPAELALRHLLGLLVRGSLTATGLEPELKDASDAELGKEERFVAGHLVENRLLREKQDKALRLMHAHIVKHWRRAADWFSEDGEDLETEIWLTRRGQNLEGASDEKEVDRLLDLSDSDFNKAFALYVSWGNRLHLSGRRFVRECLERRMRQIPEFAETVLFAAASIGDQELVERLASQTASLDKGTPIDNATALHLAAQNGHVDTVQRLVQKGATVDVRTTDEFTPLHLAAQNGSTAVVEYLILREADVNAQTARGGTALHFASGGGHESVVEHLAEAQADLEILTRTGRMTALHLAARHGHAPAVRILVTHGADLEVKTAEGLTALHLGVLNRQAPVVQCLIELGADKEAPTRDGTPLLLATEKADTEIAGLLIRQGANALARTSRGETAIDLAFATGSPDVIRLILGSLPEESRQAEVNDRLCRAVAARRPDIASIMLAHGASPDAMTSDRIPAIVLATKSRDLSCLRLLLDGEADPNKRDDKQRTALHWACANAEPQLAMRLISHPRIEFDKLDEKQRTPLHWAAEAGNLELTKMLVEAGANKELSDQASRRPVDLAVANRHFDVARYLGWVEPSVWKSGQIKFTRWSGGFGYIVPDDGDVDVYLSKDVAKQLGLRNIREGMRVKFQSEFDGYHRSQNATAIRKEG